MSRILKALRFLAYGQCTHPAVYFVNGKKICTECGQEC
jgi:hypothetical protein